MSFEEWKSLLSDVIKLHFPILKKGAFLAINIADILCFKDPAMPRLMAENISRRKVTVTKEEVLAAKTITDTSLPNCWGAVSRQLTDGLMEITSEAVNIRNRRG